MKNHIKIFIVASLTTVSTFTACKKTLDIKPSDQIESSTALSTRSGVEATVISIYATLKAQSEYGNALIGLGEALADNGRSTNRSGRYVGEAQNAKGSHYFHWTNSYSAINRINLVLKALPGINQPSFTQAQKDAYTGELKFLRALYYFDLVKTYAYIPGADVPSQNLGGVPLVLVPTETIDQALTISTPRAPIDDVYTQIYTDLDDAMAKISTTTSVKRATFLGAEALYSRVALYRKDFAKVITLASDVIAKASGAGHPLLTAANYVAGFRSAVNPESLFEVAYTIPSESLGVNVSLQTLFTTLTVPGNRTVGAGFGDLVPTSTLLTALGITVTGNGGASAVITARSADVRNQLYELGSTLRGTPYYVECTKFIGRSGQPNLDDVPVVRTSEMYLNRAEAYANLGGNDVLALADVNAIRINRGLTPAVALTGAALSTEIALQRRLELAFEGHRFLDLKRQGQDIVKPALGTTVAFTNPIILANIPQADVDASLGVLKQNPGY
jgi:hypothetical protein